MTKEEILADLALLPLGTLEKLQKYSQLLIIPDEDLLVNVTMDQMVQKAFDLADIHFPNWTDRSFSDFGRFIVEIASLFSEKDFYYLNAFANESLLRKMTVYSDAFIRSVELGHSPALTTAAVATFDVTFEAGPEYTYPKGSLILEIRDRNLKFVNTEAITVPVSPISQVISLQLHEGDLLSESQAFNGYRVDIRKTLIDITPTLNVNIENIDWTRVKVFGQSDAASKHYMVLPEEDGKISIYFGEDGYGEKPALGSNINLYYLKCKGAAVNGLTGDVTINRYDPARKATLATMTSPPSGGVNPESLASLKETTLNYFSTKFVVHNNAAVERWLNSQPEVKQSKSLAQGNNVYFRVIPADGSVATTLLTTLENRIAPFIENGYFISGLTTSYVTVDPIVVEFYHLTGYDVPNLVSLGKQLIQDFTNPLVLATYGKSFNLTDLEFLLKSKIPGLQNVVFVTVNGVAAANVTVATASIMSKIDLSDITINTFAI